MSNIEKHYKKTAALYTSEPYDRVIVWRITQQCNMNCLFCSYSNEVHRKRDDANSAEIVRVLDILGEYTKTSGKNVLISWIGGEPFLYADIFRLSELCKARNIDVSTTTNGLLLNTAEARQKVIDNFSEIVFSLDGFSDCHDRIRKHKGAFEKTTGAISALCAQKKEAGSDLLINVNTILLRENIGDFESFCEYLVQLGVTTLTFNQLGGFDRPEFYGDNRLLPDQVVRFIQVFPKIREKCESRGLIIHGGESYLKRIQASTENKKIPVSECSSEKWFWFINENGFISPCSYTSYEYMIPTTDIQNVNDIDGLENIFRKLRKEKPSKWCFDCLCTQNNDKFKHD